MTFILLVFLYYHIYLYVELVPIAYMTTFTVKYLKFPVSDASLLMSLFYGFHLGGRVLGVPVSTYLRPRTMILVDLSLTAVAYLSLLAFVHVWPAIMWPSAALAGLSMATTFATGVLWISETIPVSGRVASVFVIGYAFGGMIGPLCVGRLFDISTPMWYVYIVVAASVSHVVLFLCMLAFVRRHGDRMRSAATVERFDEIEIESSPDGGGDVDEDVPDKTVLDSLGTSHDGMLGNAAVDSKQQS
jgi:MFS transporter, FHS family, Na+ dependent glucose transporter 1